jgi:hypothetical protein
VQVDTTAEKMADRLTVEMFERAKPSAIWLAFSRRRRLAQMQKRAGKLGPESHRWSSGGTIRH